MNKRIAKAIYKEVQETCQKHGRMKYFNFYYRKAKKMFLRGEYAPST